MAEIFYIFLKTRPRSIFKDFNTQFRPQQKDWKSSYQVKQISSILQKLVSLILNSSYVKSVRFTKIMKGINFEGPLERDRSKIVSTGNPGQNI